MRVPWFLAEVNLGTWGIPSCNLFLLLYSSLPVQGGQIWIKLGVKARSLEALSQGLATGVLFLGLQLKEYTAAFFTLSDSIFGSDFYGTTSLHGLHVTQGTLGFSNVESSLRKDKGYKEVHLILKFWA